MPIEITISLDKTINEIDAFFDDLKFKAVTLAARQGINRAGMRTKSFAIKEIRQRLNLKLKDLKGGKRKGTSIRRRGHVTFEKATGTNITNFSFIINFSSRTLPLILFILGQKTPKKHTQPNIRRRSRRFEIVKGQKKSKKGLFVEKAKRGEHRYQVFRRIDTPGGDIQFKAQSAPSVATYLRKRQSLLKKIEKRAGDLLQIEYSRALQFQLNKLKL